jgi:hypothetical protein
MSVSFRECPRQDSNLRHRLRRAVLYPLSYGGGKPGKPSKNRSWDQSPGGASGEPPNCRSSRSMSMTSALCELMIDWARSRT